MHFTRLIKALDGSKFKKTLVVSKRGGKYEPLLEGSDVEIVSLNINVNSSTIRILRSIIPLKNLIKRLDPDITFSILDYANVFTLLAHRLSGHRSKLVVDVQTSINKAIEFSGLRYDKFIFSRMKKSYRRADKILCLSHGVSRELQKLIPNTRKEQYEVIHNIGIEPGAFKATENKNEYQVCICGRLVPLKGFDLVIRAVASIEQKYPKLKLVVLGEGPEKENLQQLSEDLGISDKVEFKGFVNNVQEVMSESDVFVLSSFYEGFGNVIVEAMAVGTPVISTDCPYGPSDIITHSENGLLTPVGEVQPIADALSQLFDDRSLHSSIRENGLQRANSFTPTAIANQHEKFLLKLSSL